MSESTEKPARSTSSDTAHPVRFGVLGAARIAPFALFKHARDMPGVEVRSVAETYQDAAALERYARKHRIPRAHRSFAGQCDDDA